MPFAFDETLQQRCRRRIDLPLHQPLHQMDQGHRRAGLGEPVGRFQAEQTAADHDRRASAPAASFSSRSTSRLSRNVCTPGRLGARNVQPQRLRAGREHELRERDQAAVGQHDAPALQVDRGRRAAVAQRHAAVAPPVCRLQLDLLRGDLAGQHRRQQHAVVGEPRLVADDRDRVAAERARGDFLRQPRRGHAVSDDNQRFAHWQCPAFLRSYRSGRLDVAMTLVEEFQHALAALQVGRVGSRARAACAAAAAAPRALRRCARSARWSS